VADRKVNIAEATRWHQELGRNYWPTVIKGAKLGAYRGQALLQERSDMLAFDRGDYKRAWKVSVDSKSVRFFNALAYAGVIEQGRRPGAKMPPLEALIPWVRRHLKIEYTARSGETKTRKPRKDSEEERRLAFIVARAIKERGIEGKHVLEGACDDLQRILEMEIEAELTKLYEGSR